MRFGFVLPGGDARAAADLAYEAEQTGWDGFFVYETVYGVDAWVSLAAAAMRTDRVRLGTMLTPLSRMRPWKLASEAITLDHLSGGRVVISVGLGALDTGFAAFGEVTDRRARAELLDEGLDIVTGLWAGQPFSHRGKHYSVRPVDFPTPPPPVQRPRIPIWVVGVWPRPPSMRRVLRYDGVIPSVIGSDGVARQAGPEAVRAIGAFVAERRPAAAPFDIIVEGETPGDGTSGPETLASWEEAGATWWMETMWGAGPADLVQAVQRRLRQGPPRPS